MESKFPKNITGPGQNAVTKCRAGSLQRIKVVVFGLERASHTYVYKEGEENMLASQTSPHRHTWFPTGSLERLNGKLLSFNPFYS